MKKSQRQMILIGLCGLGLVAVIYDRMQTSTVSQAQAAPASTPAAQAAAMAADDDAGAALVMPCQAVKGRLQKAAGNAAHDAGASSRDVFCPPQSWLPKVAAQATPMSRAPERANGEAFIQGHKLQAVMLSNGSTKVIVNDKSLRIGQEIDGFKLIQVDNRRALFAPVAGDGAAVELFQKTGIGQE